MNLLIENNFNYHFEILESIIVKNCEIIQEKINFEKIYLKMYPNQSVENYLLSKYPNLEIIYFNQNLEINFNYKIIATIYPEELLKITEFSKNTFYLCHEINHQIISNQVYYLGKFDNLNYFKADILPFKKLIKFQKPNIPIFIIQGNFNHQNHLRRNLEILEDILVEDYQEDFLIKLLGRGEVPKHLLNHPKVKYYENLDFQDFHYEFLNAFAIVPCISKKSHPQYYSNKLTSSINYGLAYNLFFLIDEDLYNLYQPNKSIIFLSNQDVSQKFKLLLKLFYQK